MVAYDHLDAGAVSAGVTHSLTRYGLVCQGCGSIEVDDDGRLACRHPHGPALLRSTYAERRLSLRDTEVGVNRFRDWLPLKRAIPHEGLPGVFKAGGLARLLGLDNLWIAFSGFWPERGATLRSTTFKELEAPVVCGRMGDDPRCLVVASAGNTARAFAEVCSSEQLPLLLVVPEGAQHAIWSTRPFGRSVRMLVVNGADYHDAIVVADAIARQPGFVPEGGTRNVARRDGLGTPVLAATTAIGELPRHYFQAVGSGAGGIAAWEASLRLRADGRFGDHVMRLHLAQNAPFTPMVEAWARRQRSLLACDEETALEQIRAIDAIVLSNRCPPYALAGGVFDALSDTDGRMYAVSNADVRRWIERVEGAEGIDIGPAAAVAVGALDQAVRRGEIGAGELVLLHLTEGGRRRLLADHPIHRLAPTIEMNRADATTERLRALLAA